MQLSNMKTGTPFLCLNLSVLTGTHRQESRNGLGQNSFSYCCCPEGLCIAGKIALPDLVTG